MEPTINVKELKERMAKGEKLNVIDVREEWEYEEDNMGAKLIPLNELPNRLDELEGMKDQEVILHCRSGKRSAMAQKILQNNGFTKTRNLEGGILAYNEAE